MVKYAKAIKFLHEKMLELEFLSPTAILTLLKFVLVNVYMYACKKNSCDCFSLSIPRTRNVENAEIY